LTGAGALLRSRLQLRMFSAPDFIQAFNEADQTRLRDLLDQILQQ
jgi:hypothetical protein